VPRRFHGGDERNDRRQVAKLLNLLHRKIGSELPSDSLTPRGNSGPEGWLSVTGCDTYSAEVALKAALEANNSCGGALPVDQGPQYLFERLEANSLSSGIAATVIARFDVRPNPVFA
jgi:hypothetical protein